MIYKQYLTVEKIIVKTHVPRELHPPCRKLETFRQKKEKFQLFVPVWGGIFCSMALECPGEAALLHMGMKLPPQKQGLYQAWSNRAALLYTRLTYMYPCKKVWAISSYGRANFFHANINFLFLSLLWLSQMQASILWQQRAKLRDSIWGSFFLLQAQCCTDQVYKASSSELTTCKIQIREGCVQKNCGGDRGCMSKHFARVTRPIWISEYENGKGYEVLSEKKYCKGNRIAHHKPRPNLILTQWVWDNPSVKTFSQWQWFYIDRITE